MSPNMNKFRIIHSLKKNGDIKPSIIAVDQDVLASKPAQAVCRK